MLIVMFVEVEAIFVVPSLLQNHDPVLTRVVVYKYSLHCLLKSFSSTKTPINKNLDHNSRVYNHNTMIKRVIKEFSFT